MRKSVIITCLILSGIIILDSLNAGHALAMFLLAGIIPGTSTVVSAQTMLELFTLLFGFTLSRVTLNLLHLAEKRRNATPKPQQARAAAI